MSKRVILDNKVFPSQARAAAYAGCDRSTIQRAIKRGGAVWVDPMRIYVYPKIADDDTSGDGRTYESVSEVQKIKCPCCGNCFEVKVSIS